MSARRAFGVPRQAIEGSRGGRFAKPGSTCQTQTILPRIIAGNDKIGADPDDASNMKAEMTVSAVQLLSGFPRHMFEITLSPNSLHLISVAPSINRAKS